MLKELAEKAKRIDVDKLALSVAQANAGLILERQKQQLTVGENSNGNDVGKYKSNRYARFKSSIGSQAPFGIVDLKVSGQLYDKLETKITEKDYSIDSKVSYSKYQIDRYGANIYGLQEENQQDVQHRNSIDIVKEYSNQLGL